MASGRWGRCAYVEGGAYPEALRRRGFLLGEGEDKLAVAEMEDGGAVGALRFLVEPVMLAVRRGVGDGEGEANAVVTGVERRGLRRSMVPGLEAAAPLNTKSCSLRRPSKVDLGDGGDSFSTAVAAIVLRITLLCPDYLSL